MIYLDSCALVKLCRVERETVALTEWLASQPPGTIRISSALVRVESARALLRVDPQSLANLPLVLAGLAVVVIDDPLIAAAAAFTDPLLRSLDAIHLASAIRLAPDLTAFVTYDNRLATAASGFNLPVVTPS